MWTRCSGERRSALDPLISQRSFGTKRALRELGCCDAVRTHQGHSAAATRAKPNGQLIARGDAWVAGWWVAHGWSGGFQKGNGMLSASAWRAQGRLFPDRCSAPTDPPRVSFGTHSRKSITAIALDLDTINEASGFEQAGILGGNFLRNYRMTFDFKNSRVTFVPISQEQ